MNNLILTPNTCKETKVKETLERECNFINGALKKGRRQHKIYRGTDSNILNLVLLECSKAGWKVKLEEYNEKGGLWDKIIRFYE